jgi:hypothetical protein
VTTKSTCLAECAICAQLGTGWAGGGRLGDHRGDGERLPKVVEELVYAGTNENFKIDYQPNWIDTVLRCPVCGTFYHYNYECEFMVTGPSDEDESLCRVNHIHAPTCLKSWKDEQIAKLVEDERGHILDSLRRSLTLGSKEVRAFAASSLCEEGAQHGDWREVQDYVFAEDPVLRLAAFQTISRQEPNDPKLLVLVGDGLVDRNESVWMCCANIFRRRKFEGSAMAAALDRLLCLWEEAPEQARVYHRHETLPYYFETLAEHSFAAAAVREARLASHIPTLVAEVERWAKVKTNYWGDKTTRRLIDCWAYEALLRLLEVKPRTAAKKIERAIKTYRGITKNPLFVKLRRRTKRHLR